MDPDLENVIRQALTDAKAAGKDYLSPTELAVRAVLCARFDMTASEALTAVGLARWITCGRRFALIYRFAVSPLCPALPCPSSVASLRK